jgi:hypothetical protein
MPLPSIRLRNTTGSPITLTQLAVTVPTGPTGILVGQQTGGFDRPYEILSDEQLQTEIDNGFITAEITGNDLGQGPLTTAQSQANIQAITALQIKHSLHQTTDPAAGDDEDDGYSIGSIWLNTTADRVWICTDDTSTAATWIRVNVNTWAEVLAAGNTSGANNPSIDDGQSIISTDTTSTAKGGSYTIRAGDATNAYGGDLTIRSGDSANNNGTVPLLTIAAGDWNMVTPAAPSTTLLLHGADSALIGGVSQVGGVTLRGGDASSGAGTGGQVTIRGGDASGGRGGKLTLFGGSGTGVSGANGGDVWVKTGESTNVGAVSGTAWLTTSRETYAPTAQTAPIYITTATASGTGPTSASVGVQTPGGYRWLADTWVDSLGATGQIVLRTGNVAGVLGGAQYAGDINLIAGSYTGGIAQFNTGPGSVNITAGSTNGKSVGGGNITLTAGDTTSTAGTVGGGGDVILVAGDSGSASIGSPGGLITLTAGNATGVNGYGGDVTLTAGNGTGSGTSGDVVLTPGTGGSANGFITLDYTNWPQADGTAGQVLATAGGGTPGSPSALSWTTPVSLSDITRQRGYTNQGATTVTTTTDADLDIGASRFWALNNSSGQPLFRIDEAITSVVVGLAVSLFDVNATETLIDATGQISLDAGAASNFTVSGGDLTIGTANAATPTDLLLDAGDATSAVTGGEIRITTGAGNTTSAGGQFRVTAGAGGANGTGGEVVMFAGAGGSTSGAGGNFSITAGNAVGGGTGGDMTIASGSSAGNNDGGDINLLAGTGGGNNKGGDVFITAGAAGITSGLNPAGGGVTITGGASTAANGVAGSVLIRGGVPVDGDGGGVILNGRNGVGTNRQGGSVVINTGNGTAATSSSPRVKAQTRLGMWTFAPKRRRRGQGPTGSFACARPAGRTSSARSSSRWELARRPMGTSCSAPTGRGTSLRFSASRAKGPTASPMGWSSFRGIGPRSGTSSGPKVTSMSAAMLATRRCIYTPLDPRVTTLPGLRSAV